MPRRLMAVRKPFWIRRAWASAMRATATQEVDETRKTTKPMPVAFEPSRAETMVAATTAAIVPIRRRLSSTVGHLGWSGLTQRVDLWTAGPGAHFRRG